MAKAKKGLADLSSLMQVESVQAEAPQVKAAPRIVDLDRSERIQRAAALISAALGFEVDRVEYVPFSLTSSAREGWYYYPIPPESREIVRTARAAADNGTDRCWRVTRPGFQSAFCGPGARVAEDVVIQQHPAVEREDYDTIVDSDDGRDAFSRFNR